MQASTRALMRVRFLRGNTRSSTGGLGEMKVSVLGSEWASIQMDGASQDLQRRATQRRTSKDFNSISLRYTTSRRWQKLHSMSKRASASTSAPLRREGNS